jgi:hypothetical protein
MEPLPGLMIAETAGINRSAIINLGKHEDLAILVS